MRFPLHGKLRYRPERSVLLTSIGIQEFQAVGGKQYSLAEDAAFALIAAAG